MSRASTPSLPTHDGSRSTDRLLAPRAPAPPPSRTPPFLQTAPTSRSETAEYSLLTSAETASRLSTSLTKGLTPNEATSRFNTHGPNDLPQEDPEPLWLRFLKQFKEPLILLLLASAAVSLLMGNW